MLFNPNQTEFSSDYQRTIWQYGTHIVPLDVSLADVEDEETCEGCRQIYDCIIEILEDMYNHPEEYTEIPRLYAAGFLSWIVIGSKPMKRHSNEFSHFLQKIPRFGFEYDEDLAAWSNERYPLLFEYLPHLISLAKERKQNLGGYYERCDFRLFAKRIILTLDDLLRPLSDVERTFILELHGYALKKGMKAEIKSPYTIRYIYKKLYSLELHNYPFNVLVLCRLSNSGHTPDQFERYFEIAESQPDADELIRYIQGGICVCNACNGIKKANERCGRWLEIHGARRLASMCHPAISKYRRGRHNLAYTDEDIKMLKRMIDLRVIQIDQF